MSIFEVGVIAQRVEKTLENARLGPSSKTPKLAVPVAKARRQIAPGRSSSNAPKHCSKKEPVVLRRYTTIAGFPRQMRLKPVSQHFRHHKPLLVHSDRPFGTLNQ